MPDNDYREVRIIHPDTGGIATVPDTSLAQHYRAGWALLADDLQPPAEPIAGQPRPLTQAEVEAARQQKFKADAAADETSAKAGGAKATKASKNSEE
jgi:hypothetical protein